MRKIFPAFAILIGLYWIACAFDYGLWIRRGPGGGFFPLVGGLLTTVFSALYLYSEVKNPQPARLDPKFLYPILAVLGVLGSSYLIGLLPGMLLFIFLWLWQYEKYGFQFSLGVSLATMLVIYCVFVLWLAVQMPIGILGDAVMEWWYGVGNATAFGVLSLL